MGLNIGRVRAELCNAILAKYARLDRDGRPVRCWPTWEEFYGAVERRESQGSDGKIIFDNKTNAVKAANELETLYRRAYKVYPCKRSDSGHRHLAEKKKRKNPKKKAA